MENLDLRADLSKESLIRFYKLKIRKAKARKKIINNNNTINTNERIIKNFEIDTIISQYKHLIKMTEEHFKNKGE